MSDTASHENRMLRPAVASTAFPAETHSPGMNRVLFLLSLSVFINYIDRSNLSIAAPLLKDELHLSASQLGVLLSAFFWTYGLMQIPAGLAGGSLRREVGFCESASSCGPRPRR